MYSSNKDLSEMKMIVNGYFGYKASKEIEQFFTIGELRRIAHYVDGVWIHFFFIRTSKNGLRLSCS